MMKSFVLTGIRKMDVIDVPLPILTSDHDVLIKMKTIGVCGSDIHYYTQGKIGDQIIKYPFTVGHEGAGEVVKTSKLVSRVSVGDAIAIEPAMPCWKCDQCLAGRHHTCRNLKFLGCPGQAEGCLAEYIIMPETSCFPISEKLSFDQAAISEPLAIGVYAVKKALLRKDDNIGIFGFGPIGMSVLLSALSQNKFKAYITDKLDARLNIAGKSGAHWMGNPDKTDIVSEIEQEEPLLLDTVFECCGQQEAVDQAIDILKPGGKLLIVGIPQFDFWTFDVSKLRRKEITIVNIRRQVDCVEDALELMELGLVDVSGMPTHRFPFSETKKAFDLVASYGDGVMKAMIDF